MKKKSYLIHFIKLIYEIIFFNSINISINKNKIKILKNKEKEKKKLTYDPKFDLIFVIWEN